MYYIYMYVIICTYISLAFPDLSNSTTKEKMDAHDNKEDRRVGEDSKMTL